jgi:hypothetical protein
MSNRRRRGSSITSFTRRKNMTACMAVIDQPVSKLACVGINSLHSDFTL